MNPVLLKALLLISIEIGKHCTHTWKTGKARSHASFGLQVSLLNWLLGLVTGWLPNDLNPVSSVLSMMDIDIAT